jgi:subtilase family serine protease
MFRNRDAEAKTLAWLRRHGISRREMRMSPNGEFIRVTTSVAKLERLLGATFVQYAAAEDSKHVIFRDLSYRVPQQLKSFVDFVSDTYVLPVPPSVARTAFHYEAPSHTRQSSGNVSPSLLNSFYHITSNSVQDARATQSLFESLGQSYAPSDLTSFQQSYNLPQTPIAKVIGVNQPSQCASNVNNCFEASLDVQFILAVAQNATTW